MKNYVYIETLGCSKNQVDSEVMMGLFKEKEYYMTDNPEQAQIIVVNTCGFIESAKEESVNTILDMAIYKNEHVCEYLIVTGCLAERYANDLVNEIPEVDAFVGTTAFDEIMKIVDALGDKGERISQTGNIDKEFAEGLPRELSTPSHFAFLKIAEGCDNLCTYCIIPKLRGKYRSRTIESIVDEANALAKQGVKELIVIAQDTTRYGIDIYGEYKLYELLEKLNEVEGIEWIRLQYMYPDIVDEKLIKTIASCEKVVDYFDIPVQHASNRILKRMKRNTSKEDIEALIKSIRTHIPKASIRTTMIVGFPGETEEDFEELLTFVENAKFDRLGAFTYSKEENTAAYNLDGQVDEDIMKERHAKLMMLQQDVSEVIQQNKIGQVMRVVIEETTDDPKVYVGRTSLDAPEVDGVCYVHTEGELLEVGQFVDVKIDDAMEFDVMGVKL
ncbi:MULTISPECIES: 30S ribosomal protein S12 methylthiotransferase RimO [unclassified Fusibacter]|uniref:30S ribosomal protein S12 methylthiotransferase RimO n=1 Tax=unclassified Fusibacter TaxID=2624464 RepID=UPI0010115BBF|nr:MULTISPECIES: 30S ribosomal protein S12 methylthiotransferase RimO [unclassified Fusibacter]MCK8058859.1 30S ribosomal protein S12 methylthiotransferase RimO [Fusibacter sp. A2]NPE21933.1 30S ribosomal protein S12 methylthiotransferase RimO [Fusibacter sp. A1]RXV61503.1 30S ribosomal protein S12 methylthiotransferase RimO [Fusibacter sp. A1]